MTFYHPKHYAELRKLQAASIKLQAASDKRLQPEVASYKRQATSRKLQASSIKRLEKRF